MSDADFQTAYKRARGKFGEAWTRLTNDQQMAAVARELRALETERIAKPMGFMPAIC